MKAIKFLMVGLFGVLLLNSCSKPMDKQFIQSNLINGENTSVLGVNIDDNLSDAENMLQNAKDWKFENISSAEKIVMSKEWADGKMYIQFHYRDNKISQLIIQVSGEGENAKLVREVNDELLSIIETSSNYINSGKNTWIFKNQFNVEFSLMNDDGVQSFDVIISKI